MMIKSLSYWIGENLLSKATYVKLEHRYWAAEYMINFFVWVYGVIVCFLMILALLLVDVCIVFPLNLLFSLSTFFTALRNGEDVKRQPKGRW